MKTGKRLWHIKYEMIGANILANLIGVFFVEASMLRFDTPKIDQVWQHPLADAIDSIFTPFAFSFVLVMTIVYEKPIRAYLKKKFAGRPIPKDLETRARLRLLNEPFVLIGLDFSMWGLAAAVYPLLFWTYDAGAEVVKQSLIGNISTGLITVTVAFFLLEHVLQKRLAPVFFPEGGLSSVPRTLRVRIRMRLAALLAACNIIPLLNILFLFNTIGHGGGAPGETLETLRTAVFTQAVLFIIVGVCLTILVGRNLSIPFREIIQSLRDIRNGRFENKIRVTTNDEIGYTGDVINEMAEGLKERERMRYSLALAKEVQQNLLPRSDPSVEGLDIAGTSIYCEETGGDYFDYLNVADSRLLVVVGDVSDHGISAAMLMTTARAFLRQRVSRPGRLEEVATDVNAQLVRDVEDSGRFMTLFLLDVDHKKQTIRWVNAGHDSAMVIDPQNREWTELARTGLPFGVSATEVYAEKGRNTEPGQIIVIGTDGVWETQEAAGAMFGKQRLVEIISDNRGRPARDILNAVIEAIRQFSGTTNRDDDVTLVIVKIL